MPWTNTLAYWGFSYVRMKKSFITFSADGKMKDLKAFFNILFRFKRSSNFFLKVSSGTRANLHFTNLVS
jgi:hypothetical protein